MAETGAWRIRHTTFDNPPEGRAVHWSQSISWLLCASGFIRQALTDETIHVAIEKSAVRLSPLLLVLFAIGTGYIIFRKLGLVPSCLWMVNLVALLPVQSTYHALRPDHHGLHLAFVMTSLLGLLLGGFGWVGEKQGASATLFRTIIPSSLAAARAAFIASGVIGGLAVWTGASVQLFGVGLITAGAFLLIARMPAGSDPDVRYVPSLWRLWAVSGTATSILFYIIEYAPSFPGMRLEVNHPLYWLSWLCAGELLTQLARARTGYARLRPGVGALLAGGALLLPTLLVFGPAEWHTMKDPLMQRMHRFIDEFGTYRATYGGILSVNTVRNLGILPLFLFVAPSLAGDKRTTIHEWTALWMTFLLALAYAVLALWQVRWLNMLAAANLLLAVVTITVLWQHRREDGRRPEWVHGIVAAMILQCGYFVSQQLKDIAFRGISKESVPELLAPMLQRQLAMKLAAQGASGEIRVMAGPHMATRLYYYGHVPTVASYYWENLDGLRDTTAFFAADDEETAKAIVARRGITHVIIPPSADFARMFYFIRHGAMSDTGARATLLGRMLDSPHTLPRWIRRDVALEQELQPGYNIAGSPVAGSLVVFTINRDAL